MDHHAAAMMRHDLFGIPVDALTMTQAVARCTDAVEHGGYLSVGVVNAAKVVTMRRDARLKQAVAGSTLVLADGQSVVWASRMLGSPLPERVGGIDLFLELLGEAARRAYRVYFLGARRDVLDRMLAEVGRRYPGLAVAGARDGYSGRTRSPTSPRRSAGPTPICCS
jgi:N-acetylglucosaminyldiphosphoundecaprenol N-acetyl-beta-D-mannosaminyltransferase